jgi:hypothetical protein
MMELEDAVFLCRWWNGTFSVVKAAHKNQAIESRDEIGNAGGSLITALREFALVFGLKNGSEFILEWGEKTHESIHKKCKSIT